MPAGSPPDHIERDQLGALGAVLGAGGQAVVYELPALRLPDVGGPLVYKEYKSGHAPHGGLASVVAVRNGLSPEKRRKLEEITAWPSRIVSDHGAVCGVVLPRIPDTFFHEITLLGTGLHKRIPCEVQHLFIAPDRARRLHMPIPTPEQRLAVCRDFAAGMAFLHALGIVFGDVNAKNELFRLGSEPMVMFVDCDAVRKAGSVPVMAQLNAPDWEPPEGVLLSSSTDLYKLGLFILRCLTPGAGSSLNRDPATAAGVLDSAGLQMLTWALRGRSDGRPTASQWWQYLCRTLGQPDGPPRLHTVDVGRTLVVAGRPVSVQWVADDAVEVEISGPGCAPVHADARGGSALVHPDRSGVLYVTVRNDFGEAHLSTCSVGVIELPTPQLMPVPIPDIQLPDLGAMSLPGIATVPTPGAISAELEHPLLAVQWPQDGSPTPFPPAPDLAFDPPDLRAVDGGCPVDVVSIVMSTPLPDGLLFPRKGVTP
jgi:hypothetical protein